MLLPGAAVQPGPGLPGGVGAAYRPQHEGGDQAGVHHEDLLPGGDGWSALQTGGYGNPYQTLVGDKGGRGGAEVDLVVGHTFVTGEGLCVCGGGCTKEIALHAIKER